MGILDDTAIFVAIIQQGGFSKAAKILGLSNGLISRRMAQLEAQLGVTLLKRTTRQLQLTPEGELFWQHAQRIQQELDSATSLIQSLAERPKGVIRVSAPLFFGRHVLMPIIVKFINNFSDIKIDLILTNQRLDPIKENLDLLIRGTGFISNALLADSSMKTKLLMKDKIVLFASHEYLNRYGEPQSPQDLTKHMTIGHVDQIHLSSDVEWPYRCKNKQGSVVLKPIFNSNDVESGLFMCMNGLGIGRFSETIIKYSMITPQLRPILPQYDWGEKHMLAIYVQQRALPKRVRLFLDFITAHTQNILENRI